MVICWFVVGIMVLNFCPFEHGRDSRFSPKSLSKRGWTWGLGPVWLLLAATDDALGSEKFGIGPTGVALKQKGSWTYGLLANHIWSVAGDDDRAYQFHVNTTVSGLFNQHSYHL